MSTMPPPTRSLATQYSTWLNLVNKLLDSNCLFNLEFEGNKCLIPIPWKSKDKLRLPYGTAETPFLKKLLFKSDCSTICKSLQALVEGSYDCFKAMEMLRLNVLAPLNRLTRHPEPFVRQRCCVLIRVLSGQPLAKVRVVQNAALVRNLLTLMADPVYAVRFHCAVAVMALADHRIGNEAMVELGCAERAMERLRVEHDDRVVSALLRTVGLLTACAGRAARGAASSGRPLGPADLLEHDTGADGSRTAAATGALLECGDDGGPAWTGRGLFDYLKRGAQSPDYRTAVDSVACLSRGAAALREVNQYLARDRDTVGLMVSFASSPRLRGRALRAFAAQLLCAMAGTTVGLANLRAAAAAVHWTPDEDDDDGGGDLTAADPTAARYMKKLARVICPMNDADKTARTDDVLENFAAADGVITEVM